MMSKWIENLIYPSFVASAREHNLFERKSSPFPVHYSISQKIVPDKIYWAVVVGHGRNRSQRFFYKNLLFPSWELADFFYRQEMFSMPDEKTPDRVEVAQVAEYEMENPASFCLFDMPQVIRLMFTDYILHASMMIPASLHGDEDDPSSMFYSGRFAVCGNAPYTKATEEDAGCENVNQFDSAMFGIRIRPSIAAPNRQKYLSFHEDGLPGLWVMDMGSRGEASIMPEFRESFEGAYHAMENACMRMRRMQK